MGRVTTIRNGRGWRWLTPAAAVVLCAASTCGSAAPFDRAAWQADYAYLKDEMERGYANLAWFGSPEGGVDLPDLDRRTTAALAIAQNHGEAITALQTFVEALGDGHFQPIRAGRTRAPRPNPARVKVDPKRPEKTCEALGFAAPGPTGFSLPFESLPGYRRLSDEGYPFAHAMHEGPDGAIGLISIPSFTKSNYGALCLVALDAMAALRAPLTYETLQDYVEGAFFHLLARDLRTLKEAGADALLVDIGGNAGGDDSGAIATGLLSQKPLRSPRLWISAGPVAVEYLDKELARVGFALEHVKRLEPETHRALSAAHADFAAAKASIPERACDMSWVWRERRPWDPAGCSRLVFARYDSGPLDSLDTTTVADPDAARILYGPAVLGEYRGAWTGPTYILTDGGTASAAEIFAALLRDNEAARLVGRRTSGSGCGHVEGARAITLPRSKLSIQTPDCVLLRPDGSNAVAGLAPDLPVEGDDPDARARATLAAVVGDLRKSTPEAQADSDAADASR